jgi:hypothetical protein
MRGIGWLLRKLRLAGPSAVRKKARIFTGFFVSFLLDYQSPIELRRCIHRHRLYDSTLGIW